MLVTLTPGVDRTQVLELLRNAALVVVNSQGQPAEYARWIVDTARTLRGQISHADLQALLVTPTLRQLVAGHSAGTMTGQALLSDEINERQRLFTAAADALHHQISVWDAAPDQVLTVVDTSVFIHHPRWTRDDDPAKVIASIPWAHDLGVAGADVLLILPEVVIRELDRHKESGNQTLRYRARVTLAVIDKLLPDPHGTVTIQAHDTAVGHGAVRLRVFYDDDAHRPLDDEDAEIIDRGAAVQSLAGRPVRLITMDTTMGLNARRRNLAVTKPEREVEEPSPEGTGARARRREAAAATNAPHQTGAVARATPV